MNKRTRLAAFAATLFSACVQAQICTPFTDVAANDPFCTNIQWMYNRGITTGCHAQGQPAAYCPAQFVRRDQMAAFLYRLGYENAFLQGGNAFGTTAVLGTTDNRGLQIDVNGGRALLITPASNSTFGSSPNLVGGRSQNSAAIICPGICIPTPEPVVGAVIAGGGSLVPHRVTDSFGTVSGGSGNLAGDDDLDHDNAAYATVAGGRDNISSGVAASVGGGSLNEATGAYATVPGGRDNVASGNESFAAGRFNEAQGAASIALGSRAKVLGTGSFSFSDANAFDFSSTGTNRFRVRATGGVEFVTDISGTGAPTWACSAAAGSGWNCSSDRSQKQHLRPLDGQAVLERLMEMPVFEWYPKGQNAHVKHYGPTAQDFRATFGLGDDDTMIGTQDIDGVALAAIQGLNAKLEAERTAKDAEIAALRAELAAIRSLLATIVPPSRQAAAVTP